MDAKKNSRKHDRCDDHPLKPGLKKCQEPNSAEAEHQCSGGLVSWTEVTTPPFTYSELKTAASTAAHLMVLLSEMSCNQ